MGATTTSIKLDDQLKARLKQLALARRRSAHWLMREAIAEYLDREEGAGEAGRGEPAPPTPPAAKRDEAYEWLAQLEAKGVSVKPPRRRP